MRVITACDVIPGARRQGLRLLARPAPAALGVPPRTARTRPALRARRHPEGADPQRLAPGCLPVAADRSGGLCQSTAQRIQAAWLGCHPPAAWDQWFAMT